MKKHGSTTSVITVKIPADLQEWFKQFALREYGSMQAFFNHTIRRIYEADLKHQLELRALQEAVEKPETP